MTRAIICVFALGAGLLFVRPAAAQLDSSEGDDDSFLSGADSEEPGAGEGEGEPGDDNAFLSDSDEADIEAPITEEEVGLGLREEPGKPYFALGARARWIMIPEWFVKMFGADILRAGKDKHLLLSNFAGGAEFTYRKDGFDITAAVSFIDLGWRDQLSFKGASEDGNSWEVIENDMKAILITADFLWSTSITDWFAITYGAGLGLGIKWGDIVETEATQASGGKEKCIGPGLPNGDPWCADGEEYGDTWDKLPVIPWIEVLFGTRFKPHRNVYIHVDAGFGIGFQFGGRVGYIF